MVVTGHPGYFTATAPGNIADTVLHDVSQYERRGRAPAALTPAAVHAG